MAKFCIKIYLGDISKGEKTMKTGFDNEKYLKMQSSHIKERILQFGGKLYLEFGGKLFDDFHASRVLPGFKPDSKINMLLQLKKIDFHCYTQFLVNIFLQGLHNLQKLTYRFLSIYKNINILGLANLQP